MQYLFSLDLTDECPDMLRRCAAITADNSCAGNNQVFHYDHCWRLAKK
jgi:hypothetical protein